MHFQASQGKKKKKKTHGAGIYQGAVRLYPVSTCSVPLLLCPSYFRFISCVCVCVCTRINVFQIVW